MTTTGRRVAVIAAWVTAAVLGLGAATTATAIAFADPKTPTPGPTAAAPGPGPGGERAHKRDRLARLAPGMAARGAVHGEFVVRQGDAFVTALTQRGEVTAISATSLTVKSADGYTKTYVLNGDTALRKRGEKQKKGEKAQFATGDRVIVLAVKNGETATAKRVAGMPQR